MISAAAKKITAKLLPRFGDGVGILGIIDDNTQHWGKSPAQEEIETA
jgi:hypothetical protein